MKVCRIARNINIIIIIIIILGLNARRSSKGPISSSLGEFPSYWDWHWCPGLSPVFVFIALPFAFHTLLFPFALLFLLISIVFLLYCRHWISSVFLLYGRRIATHSVDPSLLHFLGEFPGLGLALVPRCCGPRGGQRCAWSRKLDPNFCSGRGRTSNLGIRLPLIPPFSRLLRHAGGYSRTILTPNLSSTAHLMSVPYLC